MSTRYCINHCVADIFPQTTNFTVRVTTTANKADFVNRIPNVIVARVRSPVPPVRLTKQQLKNEHWLVHTTRHAQPVFRTT